MSRKNIILVKGGGSDEHEISLLSAKYIASQLDDSLFNVLDIELTSDQKWILDGKEVMLTFAKKLVGESIDLEIDAAIPCFHGYPGETGDIQSFFELIKLPYFGCNSEVSKICFNKILTKSWLENFDIPVTPYKIVSTLDKEKLTELEIFFDEHGELFIKASNQGSSVGCFPTTSKSDIEKNIKAAFKFSPYVLVEKNVKARELEIATYEYDGKIQASVPGEILCKPGFYSYEEKYSDNSDTTITTQAELSDAQVETLRDYAIKAFSALKLTHLSRIDFFLCDDGTIYLNEPNTFPGMTKYSLFPAMMENNGHKFKDFLTQAINSLL